MNNEEKILNVLAQLQQGQAKLEQGQAKLEQGQAKLEQRLDKLEQGQTAIRRELKEIKEHAEVTRDATNSLVAWADTVGVITQVNFPVKKLTTG